MSDIPISGKCDSGCGKLARYWYGNTSVATCGDSPCYKTQELRYREHCKKIEDEYALEEQMLREYGDY